MGNSNGFPKWEMAWILSTAYPHLLSHEGTSVVAGIGIIVLWINGSVA